MERLKARVTLAVCHGNLIILQEQTKTKQNEDLEGLALHSLFRQPQTERGSGRQA